VRTYMGSPNRAEPDFSTVFVVDHDPSIRCDLSRLASSMGLRVQVFSSAQEFLLGRRPDVPSCLILEVRLRGISGFELQNQLANANIQIPIIFITAHGDVSICVRAMKAGAVDFLTKPYGDQEMLDAIYIGLDRDRVRREQRATCKALRQRFELLTQRESQVLKMVVCGMRNREIAAQIGVAENTVKVHRSRTMKKMQARSVPELVRMIEHIDAQF